MKSFLKNPLVSAGIVLGLGFGGFADGIILHQILGWHHLVCVTAHCQAASIAQLKVQNTQDGFFHLGLWLVTLLGTGMLFRASPLLSHPLSPVASPWSGRILFGSILAGCGVFNLVEGVVDHHILGIHHVLPGNPHQLLFDTLFLATGALFVVAGVQLIRTARSPSAIL